MLAGGLILVATDFEDISDAALAEASAIGAELGAEVCLLHVAPPPPPVGAWYLPTHGDQALRTARERLEHHAAMSHAAAGTKTLLRAGDPAIEILAAIRELEPRLVVMGTRGRRGPARLLLGSVAERVVRDSPAPVVTVNEKATGRARGAGASDLADVILVALDRDASSEAAFELARDLGETLRCELLLLHVDHLGAPEPEWGDLQVGSFHTDVEDAQRLLDRHAAAVAGARTLLRNGDPVTHILDTIDEVQPRCAIIGKHRRSRWQRLTLGSVARGVVRDASVPVIAVPSLEQRAASTTAA